MAKYLSHKQITSMETNMPVACNMLHMQGMGPHDFDRHSYQNFLNICLFYGCYK